MKIVKLMLPLLALVLLFQCKTARSLEGTVPISATITKEGWIDCFEKGLTANGQPIWCEASAILYDGKNIFVANDKDMPDTRSSVFYWAFKNGFADTTQAAQYLTNPVLKYGKKFEDFSLTPDGKTVFLSTGFDRVKPNSKEWNAYNTIYYWQVGNENNPNVLRENSTDSSSVFLREKFSKALTSPEFPQGMPYFKIEGLAATNDRLYFGVREEGKKFDDFKYRVKIITVNYHLNNGTVELENNYKVISDINIAGLPPNFKQPMGISSIEYDHFNNRFLILTSFENGEKTGGYLWTATESELESNKMNLVRDGRGSPIAFSDKSEDIAIINKKKIIIIHDDDRFLPIVGGVKRQPQQAAYSVVEFK
ncbi:MAG: hypothetical protein ABIN89_06920 [Chitinophagaceae bacterium]